MPTYFADAWFFIALFDRHDSHHGRATRLAGEIAGRARIVTHDGVFGEVLAFFAEDGARARQLAIEGVRQSMRVQTVVEVNRALFTAGLDRYAARPDKEYSHVDCMSMVLMEQRGIQHVLTNDHHFAQAGFIVVNQ
jgi:predicted nucleic acid-binding protein